MSALKEYVTLHSISGKTATVPYPATYKAVLTAATAPPFSFAAETVKIIVHNRLTNVSACVKKNITENGGGVIDASAYTAHPTSAAQPASHQTNATLSSAADASTTSAGASPSRARAGLHGSPAHALILYGVPQRVLAGKVGAAAAHTDVVAAATPSSPTAATSPSEAAIAAATTATTPATSPSRSAGHRTGSPAAGHGGPLPYPHSPDGLRELSAAVSDAAAVDAGDEDDLISLLQGAPQRVYDHPTMRYISNKVNGNLTTLRAVMEQIRRVAPVFYAWVEANPQKFLSALNRVGERSLQQVRDQLRLLALQAVAGQMSGDGPSRRVMMLEVNTQDGSPDVYQVEVQVGDFSSTTDSSTLSDSAAESSSSSPSATSDSLYYLGGADGGAEDAMGEEYEEVPVEDEDENNDDADEEGGAALDVMSDFQSTTAAEEEKEAAMNHLRDTSHADSTGGGGAAMKARSLDQAEGEEGAAEPHRGAIRLSPTSASSPAPAKETHAVSAISTSSTQGAAAAAAAVSAPRPTPPLPLPPSQPSSSTVAPTPPPGAAPTTRGWRPSATRAAAVTKAAGADVSTGSATTTGMEGSGAPTVNSAVDAAHTRSAEADGSTASDDVRLVRLREESRAVDALRQEYARNSDDALAQRVHRSIMQLRPKYFTTVSEVCTEVSRATLSRDTKDAAAAASLSEQQRSLLLLLRRLVRCACDFFVAAEEFYATLEEEGHRGSLFGASPEESLAAWAAVAALSQLLLCDVDAVVEDAFVGGASTAPSSVSLVPASAGVAAGTSTSNGPRRVGALRSLQSDNSLWTHPALHWALAKGPEALLASLLRLCRQQRAVLLWYSSHYLVKAVGKTIQTMAYVLGGTEEAQQPVALRRLKMTSKAHKADEVADCVREVAQAGATAAHHAVPEAARRQWFTLMRNRYQQLVRPVEGDLPTPHMSSNTLYLCDTRHVLPPKEALSEEKPLQLDSAVRWWPGYCDERNTLCADKWCLAATLRPWNAVMASENAQDGSVAERTAVTLTDGIAEAGLAESTLSMNGLLTVEQVRPVQSGVAPSTASRHSAVLYECVPLAASATPSTQAAQQHGLSPCFGADLHIVDAQPSSAHSGATPSSSLSPSALSTQTAGGAVSDATSTGTLQTYLATVVRNFSLPAAAAHSSFLQRFFEVIARYPKMPVAAATRQAALASASAADAPWFVCEYLLLDFGGPLRCLAGPGPQAATATPSDGPAYITGVAAPITSTAGAVRKDDAAPTDDFVRMPSVPLGRRLSEPRPVSAVSRTRSNSQPESECRAGRRASSSTVEEEDTLRRQYARTHAIDALYEMMLGSLLEQQPSGEAAVLDHLISFLDTSEAAMTAMVQRRQAEMVSSASTTASAPAGGAAAVAVPVEAASSTAPSGSFTAPQPPSKKRNANSRPSLSRKK